MTEQSSDSSSVGEQVIKTACQLGPCECGINVYVREGRITRIEGMTEHPYNQGSLCPRGLNAIDHVYHEERLKYPMKKVGREWNRISWDEALDTIASRLTEIKEKYGPTAFAACIGDPMQTRGATAGFILWRFLDVYGSPNMFTSEACYRVRAQAQNLTFGFLRFPFYPDVENSKCIIIWAHNPHKSEPQSVRRIESARKNGAKLIVIDPRRTPYAEVADIHIQPRPGTDCALMLAMMNTIISEGLYDRTFVDEWTYGFDKLSERVNQYLPEEVEKITGVPAEKIKESARMFATIKPSCIQQAWSTLDQVESGFQNSRAISILHAITGNVDKKGGIYHVALAPMNFPRLFDMVGDVKAPHADDYPLFSGLLGMCIAAVTAPVVWIDALLTGKPYQIKAMYVAGANPMVCFPNTNKMKQALETLDFLVVMDIFMTPTAEMADIVLPAATFLERTDILQMVLPSVAGIPYAMLGKQVIPEMWESWPDWKFTFELAKRMGYGEYFPWKNVEELIDYYLEPSGLTVKQLRDENPSGVYCGAVEVEEYWQQHPELPRFPTPSGKIELYCETLEALGYDPLPSYTEPTESPYSNPEVAEEYPLILSTGARSTEYWHSSLQNIPELRKSMPEPIAEIHPQTTAKYGIGDGEIAIIETRRGSIEMRIKATEDIMPGLISIPHGWEKGNANILTDDAPACKESGYPALHAILCRIRSTSQETVGSA
jgi:anaerobic selenocysteine-containing dehydrogenase